MSDLMDEKEKTKLIWLLKIERKIQENISQLMLTDYKFENCYRDEN